MLNRYDSHHKSQVRPSWDVTKAMLLMGDKYDVVELRETAMEHLERLFPPPVPVPERHSTPNSRASSPGPSPMTYLPSDVIGMAGASRNLSSQRLKIAILYQCCLLDVSTLVASLSGDGALSLTSEEFYQCLAVRAQLPRLWMQIYQDLFAPLCTPYCRRLSTCGWVVEVVRDEFMKGYEERVLAGTSYDPLDATVWARLLAAADKRGICENCHIMWCKRYVELRERAMDILAEGFRCVDNPHYQAFAERRRVVLMTVRSEPSLRVCDVLPKDISSIKSIYRLSQIMSIYYLASTLQRSADA